MEHQIKEHINGLESQYRRAYFFSELLRSYDLVAQELLTLQVDVHDGANMPHLLNPPKSTFKEGEMLPSRGSCPPPA